MLQGAIKASYQAIGLRVVGRNKDRLDANNLPKLLHHLPHEIIPLSYQGLSGKADPRKNGGQLPCQDGEVMLRKATGSGHHVA